MRKSSERWKTIGLQVVKCPKWRITQKGSHFGDPSVRSIQDLIKALNDVGV